MRRVQIAGLFVIAVPAFSVIMTLLPTSSEAQTTLQATPQDKVTTIQRTIDAMNGRLRQLERRVTSLEQAGKAVIPGPRKRGSTPQVSQDALEVISDEVYRIRGRSGAYAGGLEDHWISRNIGRGHFILLEDNSLWEVDSIDKITTSLWLAVSQIIVLPTRVDDVTLYRLVNIDDGETVHVRFRGYATRQR